MLHLLQHWLNVKLGVLLKELDSLIWPSFRLPTVILSQESKISFLFKTK